MVCRVKFSGMIIDIYCMRMMSKESPSLGFYFSCGCHEDTASARASFGLGMAMVYYHYVGTPPGPLPSPSNDTSRTGPINP